MLYVDFPSWISPTVVSFLPVRWYAVMYLVAFAIAYVFFRKRCKNGALGYMDEDKGSTLFIYVIVGLILGARIFSVLFYDGTTYYWTHPWMIFWPFRNGSFVGLPGMSYHGGVVGGVIGGLIFARKYGYRFFDVADALIPGIPLGYTFGRLGNFINGELWGRCTGTSYGMIFPDAPSFSTSIDWVRKAAEAAGMTYTEGGMINLPRHPSQLYEAFFEGIFLFVVLWFFLCPLAEKKKFGRGFITGSYFAGYGLVRFIIEYFREPDSQLGFIIALGKETEPTALFKSLLNISMGQILCFIMIVGGVLIALWGLKQEKTVFKTPKAQKRNKK
ncbi:MAG: prolipoprotein diacylglyceryl transferase [Sphaerochaetaceae bacterium]|nr:prolipoprotein diacylglyceryl transferase [Sphaerochaetaceae bacterium]